MEYHPTALPHSLIALFWYRVSGGSRKSESVNSGHITSLQTKVLLRKSEER